MEIGGRREGWEKKGTRPRAQSKTRHKSKMVWQHVTFGFSVLVSNRGAKLFSSRAKPLLRLDVLIVLISCCLSSITQKSRINHSVNINQGAESWRAGNSFREKEGIHSHTAWQTETVLNLSISFKGSSHGMVGTDQIFTGRVTCYWSCNPCLYSFTSNFSESDGMNFRYYCETHRLKQDYCLYYKKNSFSFNKCYKYQIHVF